MTTHSSKQLEVWIARRDEAIAWLSRNAESGQRDWLQSEVERCSEQVEAIEGAGRAASNSTTGVAGQIERSQRVREWLVKSGRNLPARETARIVTVAASMQLALEHHGAVLLLAKSGCRGSLLVLLRSIYEAYIWSSWLFRIAKDDHLVGLAHNRLTPSLERMIADLDRQGLFDRSMLVDMKPLIKRMDGFVHGGYQHLRYRIHGDRVEPRYPDELIIDALRFADLFAIMTLLEWPAMLADVVTGDRLYGEARALLELGP